MYDKISEALRKALEQSKKRNYKETVELAINLKDIDLSNPKNRLDFEVVLPKGRGKEIKVGVFATGELAVKSREHADLVISPEELEELSENKRRAKELAEKYNFFLAEASLMPLIGKKLGIVLGPRGKMPKPISPLIEPSTLIKTLRATIKVRSRENKTFHVPIGTRDMSIENLAENIETVLKKLEDALEKGRSNLKSVYVKTTMGSSVRIV